MTDLPGLLERVITCEGPDREIDAAIFHATMNAEVWSYHDNSHIDAQISIGIWKGRREDHIDFDSELDNVVTWRYSLGEDGPSKEYGAVPFLTASIDAAIGLLERVLPGCAYRVQRNLDGTHWAELQRLNENHINAEKYDVWNEGGNQKTAPLAILAALFTALIAHLELARVK